MPALARSLVKLASGPVLAAGIVAGLAMSPDAKAGVIVSFVQQGNDVVMTLSGSINTDAFSYVSSGNDTNAYFVTPTSAYFGTVNGAFDFFTATLSGPTTIGTLGPALAASGSGDTIAFDGRGGGFNLPVGYVSGSPLSSTMTFAGATLDSLGLTSGVYSWSWGSGASADTLVIGVPEPASMALLGAGLLGLGLSRRRR